jgi:hypothetical protein
MEESNGALKKAEMILKKRKRKPAIYIQRGNP